MMPRLDMESIVALLELSKTKEGLEQLTDTMMEEQNDPFMAQLFIATMQNSEAVRGFIICYVAIREKVMERVTGELERLFKL